MKSSSLASIRPRQLIASRLRLQRYCRWPALAGVLLLACCTALLWPAVTIAAPPTQLPEPDVQPGSELQSEPEILSAADLQGITAVAVGLSHTCSLNTSGGVLCWGDNSFGQLGNGTRTVGATNPFPRNVNGLATGVQAIATGDVHTCALTAGGGVKCWGSNAYGQLGDGTTDAQLAPIDVTGLISDVQAITAGGSHTCALTTAGGVKCWGDLATTPQDVPGLTGGVSAIAAGFAHTCAIVGGGVQCWGANDTGQLGNGTTTSSATPVDVTGLSSGVKAIAAGGAPVDRFTSGGHTCAVTTGGGVQCWGWNDAGQLGDDTNMNRLTPVNVTGLGSGVQDVTAGDKHTCAITGDIAAGTSGLRCWGDNRYGQLGVGTTEPYATPVQVGGFTSGVQTADAGSAHTCAVTAGGGLKCWGRNASGQVGNFTIGAQSLLPVNVLVPSGITFLPQVGRQVTVATASE
jgi:alpha-tubulin suppressor-like RCC1 family protein